MIQDVFKCFKVYSDDSRCVSDDSRCVQMIQDVFR